MYWKDDGGERLARLHPGAVFARSEQLVTKCYWENAKIAVVTISHEAMERSLPEPFTGSPIELKPVLGGPSDRVLARLMSALGQQVQNGRLADPLLWETTGNRLAVCAAVRFGVHPPAVRKYRAGLNRDRLARVLEYIESSLADNRTVREMAAVAGLSSYHFGKMFQRSMGQTVHQYVLRRRHSRARRLLAETSGGPLGI